VRASQIVTIIAAAVQARLALQVARSLTALLQDGARDHCADCHDAQGNEHQVIEIAQDGDEVGNQINWTEGVAHNADGEQLRIPRHPRIAACEVERIDLALEVTGALLPRF
jgi:hypothetical protein